MSANDYTVADYIEANYFTSSSAPTAVEGAAAITAEFAFVAEGTVTQAAQAPGGGGNDYVEDGYIDNTYFTQDTVQGSGTQEGNASLVSAVSLQASAEAFKTTECLVNVQADLASTSEVVRGFDSQVTLTTSMVSFGATTKDITLTAFDDAELVANGGLIIEGSVVQPGENGYVDGQYIDGNYFVAGVGVVPGITATLSAVIGKVVEATTNSGSAGNDYIDNDYIENGYFEGGAFSTTTNSIFSLTAELTLDETGPINASASLSSSFTLTAEALELTAPQEANAFLSAEVTSSSDINVVFGVITNLDSLFVSSTDATKAFGGSSDISADFATSSDAQRARGVEANFVEQVSVTTINSRIRDNNVSLQSQFLLEAFGQRGRGIDLYAFTNGQLTADINAIRDSNLLANTFFDIGTDFIRQRDNSVEADADTNTTTLPIRIRDTSLETQDAFSFGSFGVKTTDIQKDLVDTFIVPDVEYSVTKETPVAVQNTFTVDITIDIFRGFESQQDVFVNVDLIPNVTREMSSDIYYAATFVGSGNATLDCDMVAFDDSETTAIVNARFRANSEMFSIPGFNLVANNTRLRLQAGTAQAEFVTDATPNRILGFVSEPAESQAVFYAFATRIHPGASAITRIALLDASGVVRFYFFPTDFSFTVIDEPLANTFFSRTRETGVNI